MNTVMEGIAIGSLLQTLGKRHVASSLLLLAFMTLGVGGNVTHAQEPPEEASVESQTEDAKAPPETAETSETEQEQPEEALSVPGELIDFTRDVAPIFEAKCLSCHGPEDEKSGFRIDDQETVFGYLEAGDLESSSMWVDYLVTDDADLRMPPATTTEPPGLKPHELAVVKLWIEEGAKWGPWEIGGEKSAVQSAVTQVSDVPLATRIWEFQGLFHPASTHMPIALISISGVFVLLSFVKKASFEPAAFHCLWIGALGAVAACIMGWSYAVHQGWGAGYSFDFGNDIDRHRWLGIAVAVGSLLLIPVARHAIKKETLRSRLCWCLGALILAGGVSITGYQGGELVFGEDHYEKEFNRLFPDVAPSESEAEVGNTQAGEADSSESSQSNSTSEVKEG